MGMTIDNIKHCLKVMIDCEVCEECNLYGTTGTDHCEHDCIYGALDIIDKYQKIEQIVKSWNDMNSFDSMVQISEVVEGAYNNLCDSCTNIGRCIFQSGIIRTKCAFYMPPHIEPDNCGNYVVMQPTVEAIPKANYEARLKADMVAMLKDIKKEFDVLPINPYTSDKYECKVIIQQKIDKLKGEEDGSN